MYLVPLHEPTSMGPDPTAWLVTALVDELEALAVECREAAAAHLAGTMTERDWRSVHLLQQAGATCADISWLIRRRYVAGSRRR